MPHDDMLQLSLKEPVFHGDVLFPYTFYHCMIPQTFQDLLAHWHEEAEIGIIRSGSCFYHIASAACEVMEGDLIFLSPNTIHSITEVPGASMISDTLVFHMNLLGCSSGDNCAVKYLQPIQQNLYFLTPVIHPGSPGYSELLKTMQSIMGIFITESVSRTSGLELFLKEQFFHLFYLLYTYGYIIINEKENQMEISDEKIKTVLTYMETHYKEPLRISTLAALCNFSEVHFMNLFKKTIGTSCIDYLNLYRLNKAAGLLTESNEAVINIALDCGFTNISYFNRQFRSKFHMTPLEYRKRRG